MKKLHILLAALLLLNLLLPVQAAEAVSWSLEGGTLTLSGQGPMDDYISAAAAPWYSRRAEITKIVIRDGITAIGSNSFTFCENLTSLSLPQGLLSIGKNAFWGCGKLQQIALPDSLEYMGTCAFFKTGLTGITVPAGVTMLEQGVFGQCTDLKTAVLPDTLVAIHKDAFSRCYRLESLTLPAALETVGEHAFFACVQLKELAFREHLSSIGLAAFYGCSKLETLRFTGSAPKLSELAFLGISATVHYPTQDDTWAEVAGKNYGGSITWADGCTHHYSQIFTQPTCESRGYTTFTCTLCGHSYTDLFVDPLGHSFTQYIPDGNATADADGTKTAHCDHGCGATHTVADEGSRLPATLSSDVYQIDEETVCAVPIGTTAAQFCAKIHQKDIQLLKNGQPLSDTDSVGTGTVVQLLRGAQVIRAWVVIVTGDLNGDGTITITDMLMAKGHILKKATLEGIFAQAADTNGDHGISITDYLQIKAHILGKKALTAR